MTYNDIYVVTFDYTLITLVPSDIAFLRHLSCAQLRREGGKSPLNFLNFKIYELILKKVASKCLT